jgi:hypothetical protein
MGLVTESISVAFFCLKAGFSGAIGFDSPTSPPIVINDLGPIFAAAAADPDRRDTKCGYLSPLILFG